MRTVLSLLVICAACDSDPKPGVDAPGGTDAPGIDADLRPREGFIVIVEQLEGGTTLSSDVDATFFANPPFGLAVATDGMCSAFDNPQEEGASAGTINITGTTAPVTLTPVGTGNMVRYQDAAPPPDDLFAPNATLTVQATGDFVPAFNTTLTAPPAFAGYTAPATLPRAAGQTLAWTAGASSGMWILIVGATQTSVRIVLCRVPDNGSYTLTPSNLALLPATATTGEMGFMIVGRGNTKEVPTGAGNVLILALDSVVSDVMFTP
jgi:hypothetical protein